MDLNEYQIKAIDAAFYEKDDIAYNALGITGEAGEIADHVKKMLRDDDGILTPERRLSIVKELGDVLWYVANMARRLEVSLETVAQMNLVKIEDRTSRNVQSGSGDSR